ncbi:hypothetical protein SERLA73DRAFT_109083 [Serpula lacrymans var. lacrymans S7.3]|uniref:Polyketide synthase-like phosphopantetheine-binding domain-containing protein n=2 Tax=Serpula lacrymans var. lacrymans TaxID=341189 RepID=F8Q0L1_SERL3|nr:uncharacterized protein SERLADRAFT_438737 [Serpula lacrymans var. lacrymans S7.9]EGN97840.1 hypothetical protein SERLA73DRAFT_109083 [Serpula lacrymans var. lacrymans S7.3]EGO23427.1 hypothetical protein SERLADRAFT_438737 [Serpula lacrymans var. lacrymans S7.9]
MNIHDHLYLPIPDHPKTQCLDSKTFVTPVLNGSLTIPEIYDEHLRNSSEHPLFIYPRSADGTLRTILWPEAVYAIRRAGLLTLSRIKASQDSVPPSYNPTVAILASSDHISFFAVIMGMIYVGCPVFPISPRNSSQAVAHLLRTSGATHLYVGVEQIFQDTAAAAMELLRESESVEPQIHPMPIFEELFNDENQAEVLSLRASKSPLEAPALILHSSGSTAFPKLIVWTHYHLIHLANIPHYGERDLTGIRNAAPSMPMFHAMGAYQVVWTAATGMILSVFEPKSPATVPTADNAFKHAIDTNSDIIFCVPSFVEAWYENPDYVRQLPKLKGIFFGGAPMNQEIGDALSKIGAPLFSLYGSSEISIIGVFLPKTRCPDWQYFRLSNIVKPEFIPSGEGTSELIIHPHPTHVPTVFNIKRGEADAYYTSDLLTPHPTLPGYWKVYGRADDQIMHSTAEKTNPGPLEKILVKDLHVRHAIMFGRGRFHAGLLIEPRDEHKFDISDTEKLADFRNKIWPTVEIMNDFAPKHSRIFKEMIIVASPSKPFVYTAKHTLRRAFIIDEYEPEIEALYEAVAESTRADIPPPSAGDLSSILDFVRTIITKTLGKLVDDDVNIFEHGADSLQATWIRNTIFHALRTSAQVDTRNFSSNLVYQYPSIRALASFMHDQLSSTPSASNDKTDAKCQDMLQMAEKYSQAFSRHVPSIELPETEAVLVTGTTGGVGAYLLGELLNSAKIARVYAINRKHSSGNPLLDRQKLVLGQVGLDPALASHPKLVLLEADVSEPEFGLGTEKVDEMRTSVTHIIHNAWPVDFNLTLNTFDPQVKGVRNLIDFALSSPLPTPPRLAYISSGGILQGLETGEAKELPVDCTSAVGSGYSESKWVSEKVLTNAAAETSLRPIIIRLGQISGGVNGFWKEKEWLPSMIRSSIYLKCLPVLDQSVAWLPMDTAAKAVVEMRDSNTTFVHVAHPKETPWSTIFAQFSTSLDLPLVPYKKWLECSEDASLRSGGADARENPASVILDFFRAGAMGLRRMSMEEAKKASPTLGDTTIRPLGASDVDLWLSYWRKSGFISNQV